MNDLEKRGQDKKVDTNRRNFLTKVSGISVAAVTAGLLSACGESEVERLERFALEKTKRDEKNAELIAHYNSGSGIKIFGSGGELQCYHSQADGAIASTRNSKIYKIGVGEYGEDKYMVEMNKNGLTPDLLKGSFSGKYSLYEHCQIIEEVTESGSVVEEIADTEKNGLGKMIDMYKNRNKQ